VTTKLQTTYFLFLQSCVNGKPLYNFSTDEDSEPIYIE
jgi:hypothetical protein